MKKINQKGFTYHVTMLAILALVLGAMDFAGYRVYQNRNIDAKAAGVSKLYPVKDGFSDILFKKYVNSVTACSTLKKNVGVKREQVYDIKYTVTRKSDVIPGISTIVLRSGNRIDPQPYTYVKAWSGNIAQSNFTISKTYKDRVQFFMDYDSPDPTEGLGGLPLSLKASSKAVGTINPASLKSC